MYLSICGDPDCPNKTEVETLKREIRKFEELEEKYDDLLLKYETLKEKYNDYKLRREYY